MVLANVTGANKSMCVDSVACWGSKRSNQVIVLRHVNTGFSLEIWASSNGWARVLADGVCNVVWSSGAMEKQSFDPVSWALVANLEKRPHETILALDEPLTFGQWLIEPTRENITIKHQGDETTSVAGATFILGGGSLHFNPTSNNAELGVPHHKVEQLFESRVPVLALTVRGRLDGNRHLIISFTTLSGEELTSVRLGVLSRVGGLRFVPAKLLGVSRDKVRLVLEDGRLLTEEDNSKLLTAVISVPGAPTTSEEFAKFFAESSDEEEDAPRAAAAGKESPDEDRIGCLRISQRQSMDRCLAAAQALIADGAGDGPRPKTLLEIVAAAEHIAAGSALALALEQRKQGSVLRIQTGCSDGQPEIRILVRVLQPPSEPGAGGPGDNQPRSSSTAACSPAHEPPAGPAADASRVKLVGTAAEHQSSC